MSRNTLKVCSDCGCDPCECVQLEHPIDYTERSFFCDRCGMSHNGFCPRNGEED